MGKGEYCIIIVLIVRYAYCVYLTNADLCLCNLALSIKNLAIMDLSIQQLAQMKDTIMLKL